MEERVYRRIDSGQAAAFEFPVGDGTQHLKPAGKLAPPSRQTDIGNLGREALLATYAPAAILINHNHECLFLFGSVDFYLRLTPGRPTLDVLALVNPSMRTRLKSAISRAIRENGRAVADGGRLVSNGSTTSYRVEVQPVASPGENLLLICFVDALAHHQKVGDETSDNGGRLTELEQDLEATRTELQGTIRSPGISNEKQKLLNQEASSVNEEYQPANEQLLTSKEELQSLNEELSTLNNQLQETLERQRTTSNDLQNILFSTDVATIFLDIKLNIRFFTPAMKLLFRILPTDIGRPLTDLSSLSADSTLVSEAQAVLRSRTPFEREIEVGSGAWFVRRILPYQTHDKDVDGVVITFVDITQRKQAADAAEAARRQEQLANAAKSRFLAAASHDLRQPLQALSLMRGILAKTIRDHKTEDALALVGRLDDAAASMSGMLNTLLDINQLEAGTIRPELVRFRVDDLLNQLRDEFSYLAQAQGLRFAVVPCRLSICSDPRLLEQMIRNLLANALKYTKRGKVLLGCRRRGGMLDIEVWDTGTGIPSTELQAIFEEYHQLDNVARDRELGLGLGLSIVKRLATLLGHRIAVRSQQFEGSVFTVEVALAKGKNLVARNRRVVATQLAAAPPRAGAVLVIEDDADVRHLLELLLTDEGHQTAAAPDGATALKLVTRGKIRPDLILADYNLPNGLNGLQAARALRDLLGRQLPVIILTGDISTATLRDIALEKCERLHKPVKSEELKAAIQRLLFAAKSPTHNRAPRDAEPANGSAPQVVYVVDDDNLVRAAICGLLEQAGLAVQDFASCEAFLESFRPGDNACLLIDADLPGMKGLELLQRLSATGHLPPAVMITGVGDVQTAVCAMKAGAMDFIEKPIAGEALLAQVELALGRSRDTTKLTAWRQDAAERVASVTPRQHEIMGMVLAGHPSKNIAADLGISQRTVESHRAAIMKKTGAKSIAALARLAVAGSRDGIDRPLEQD